MDLDLDKLTSMHPALRAHPVDFLKCGGLALQRSGHLPPVEAGVVHDGLQSVAVIGWTPQAMTLLGVLDRNRVTEDGAEAIALTYVHATGGWVVKRRLQRGESADWLLRGESGWLALEVSGTIDGDPHARLDEKKLQVGRCSLEADRLAVVVAFSAPFIAAGRP